MKKNRIIICISCILIIIFALLMLANKHDNNLKLIKSNEVMEYLNSHYAEPMNIINISIVDGCYAECNPISNSTCKFMVMFWPEKNQYVDSYLQKHLEYEGKEIIQAQLKNKYPMSEYYMQLSGAPVNIYENLYKFYERYNRPMSWYDMDCNEEFEFIHLTVSNIVSDYDIKEIIDIIQKSPLKYKRIVISKNEFDNVIFELNK